MRRKADAKPQSGREKNVTSSSLPRTRSELPRSYSTPTAAETRAEKPALRDFGSNVARSYSSPEPQDIGFRRNSDFFYRPPCYGSRNEIDSDLEKFEQYEQFFIDADADQDDTLFGSYGNSQKKEEPRKVKTSLLPGSGIHRVSMSPDDHVPTLREARFAKRDQLSKIGKKGNIYLEK